MIAAGISDVVDPWAGSTTTGQTSWGGEVVNDVVDPWAGGTSSGVQGGSSGALEGLGTSMAISGAAQAFQTIGQMVNGIINYYHQSEMIEIGERMQVARYGHQDRMAQINRDMQLNVVKGQEQKMIITRDGQKQLNGAVEERKKAEDSLKIAEAREKEMKLTEKTGKTKSKALDKLFGQYSYGNPCA